MIFQLRCTLLGRFPSPWNQNSCRIGLLLASLYEVLACTVSHAPRLPVDRKKRSHLIKEETKNIFSYLTITKILIVRKVEQRQKVPRLR